MGLFGNPDECGLKGSGIISRVAPDVVDLQPGDRVGFFFEGSLRTSKILARERCLKIPESSSSEDFAAIYSLVNLSQIQSGEVSTRSFEWSPLNRLTTSSPVSTDSFCLWRCRARRNLDLPAIGC